MFVDPEPNLQLRLRRRRCIMLQLMCDEKNAGDEIEAKKMT
jgi:hypothetical protein